MVLEAVCHSVRVGLIDDCNIYDVLYVLYVLYVL
jgi:hypothetical protein